MRWPFEWVLGLLLVCGLAWTAMATQGSRNGDLRDFTRQLAEIRRDIADYRAKHGQWPIDPSFAWDSRMPVHPQHDGLLCAFVEVAKPDEQDRTEPFEIDLLNSLGQAERAAYWYNPSNGRFVARATH